ncbi:MAG TPA: bifunctional diaminohydroxyphosphoribosylaminopyrimidine deaminase/5-amino-6-(5-phosphoribosylamino)uracil reductase RibD [Gemmatimonadaceae bacterium]|nr:bifunctional diaminohydroxyphosphoribosylaminopyrimidine deaminase/5-amino-6-(5-phosphoribosylamino)uracil reductase RibD [Gemmatimonadaceae bacterium]
MVEGERPARARESAYMRRALALARKGWGQTAPNPLVGAVVVRDGQIVGEGFHARFGEAHAEVVALSEAGDRARGATVYATLEPCAHTGKTPPCAGALIAAGVARVVAAAGDPNPVARGGGKRLAEAGIAFEHGLEERAARELNAPYFRSFTSDRPWVTLKLAVSIDGAIADGRRSPGWLTGESARREVHRMRAGVDAIAVGIGTVLVDDPMLTVRDARHPRVPPRRVVFDRQARLPLESALVRSVAAASLIVIASEPDAARVAQLAMAGVEVIESRTTDEALRALAAIGVRSLLVEGGAGIAGALLGAGLVDRLVIFQAPILLGSGALHAFSSAPPGSVRDASRLDVLERRAFGTDIMTVYAISSI